MRPFEPPPGEPRRALPDYGQRDTPNCSRARAEYRCVCRRRASWTTAVSDSIRLHIPVARFARALLRSLAASRGRAKPNSRASHLAPEARRSRSSRRIRATRPPPRLTLAAGYGDERGAAAKSLVPVQAFQVPRAAVSSPVFGKRLPLAGVRWRFCSGERGRPGTRHPEGGDQEYGRGDLEPRRDLRELVVPSDA